MRAFTRIITKKVSNYFNIEIQDKDFKYKPLTPIDNADDDGEYSKALYQALKNDKVKNIAVTGPYGSGKSSLLKTFEKNHTNKDGFKFLNITLGSFNAVSKTSNKSPTNTTTSNVISEDQNTSIEKSLLQQIIYKVEGKKLPDSHFNRVELTNGATKLGTSILIVSWAISIYYYVNPSSKFFQNIFIFKDTYSPILKIFVLLSTISIIQLLLNLISKPTLSKLGVATAEITFNERRGDSILNKHLDEIIYFFSKTDFNVVFFEDLDRFDDKEIFVKLREINILLNNSDQIKSIKKSIKFVYALGDDVFKNTDRTKLFDFIVPVIPLVNSSNAAEMLKKEIKLAFNDHTIHGSYFNDVTLYIDEMRLLLNITNEFVIYKKKLSAVSKIELRDDKLLSMIIYKNKYPKDFVSLNYGKSVVNSMFRDKRLFQSKLNAEIEESIKTLNNKLENIDKEICKTLDELRAIYISKIFELNSNKSYFQINGQNYNSLLKEDAFNKLRSIEIREQQTNYLIANSFSDIEHKVDPYVSYADREQSILNRNAAKKQSINNDIDDLRSKKDSIQNQKLRQLIANYPNFDFFSDIDKNQEDDWGLLRFLISSGYIDEDYESYTSFFYEGELTSKDKQFLMSVISHEPLEIDYSLTNIEDVFNRLISNPERFSARAILNLDLFQHLVSKVHNINIKEIAFRTLSESDDGAFFTFEFLFKRKYAGLFISDLSNYVVPIFWERAILKIKTLNEHNSVVFLKKLLENISVDYLKKINNESFFTDYLSTEPSGLDLFNEMDVKKSGEIIIALNLKFTDLSRCNNPVLIDYIYKESAYEINSKNIIILLGTKGKASESESNSNYSSIVESSKIELINYVNENINEYAIKVLREFGEENEELETPIVKLLNHEDLLADNAIYFINTFKFKVDKISDVITEGYRDAIVKKNKMECTWDNVLIYFSANKDDLNTYLISFLNQPENNEQLSQDKLSSRMNKISELSKKIIYSNELTDEAYKKLLTSIPFWYPDLSDLTVSNDKIKALLHKSRFQLTISNFEFITQKLGDLSAVLIEINFQKFITESQKYELNWKHYKRLLESTILTKAKKIKLIKTIEASMLIDKPLLAKLICEFSINKTKEKIFKNDVFEAVILNKIGLNNQISLFNQYKQTLDSNKIIELLTGFDEPISRLVEGGRPKIPANKESLIFAEFLEQKDLLSSIENDGFIRLNPKGKLINK